MFSVFYTTLVRGYAVIIKYLARHHHVALRSKITLAFDLRPEKKIHLIVPLATLSILLHSLLSNMFPFSSVNSNHI